MRDFVQSTCAKFPPAHRQRLILVIEELFCNTIDHGYRGDSSQPVWLTLEPTEHGCRVVYEDESAAYNPFENIVDRALVSNVERRGAGGLGIFLVAQICSITRYERRDQRNVIDLFLPLDCSGTENLNA